MDELARLKYRLGALGFLLRGYPDLDIWWLHSAGTKKIISPKSGLPLEELKVWCGEKILKL
jgi:hypothetical protein